MRIAIYSDTCFYPQVNGVANAVKESAFGLAKLGHEVCLFTVSKAREETLREMVDNKFKICLLPSLPFWGYERERMSLVPGLSFKKLKKFKPDVIHVHTPFSVGWEGAACAKFLKVPLVGTHHTFFDHYLEHVRLDYDWAKGFSWKLFVRFYNLCDLVLNPSRALNGEMISRGLKKPGQVLANPIDTEFYRPADTETKPGLKKELGFSGPLAIYTGRISYEKNIAEVIKVFALAAKKFTDARLLIVGDGPEKENLEKFAHELGISDRVKFAGFLFGAELVKALQAADVFITASLSENQPVSVLEAMSCGLPVIASRAAGIPEIVKDGENGFLAAPGNTEEMAEKLIALLADPEIRKKFSQNSRSNALNFSREKIADELAGYYADLKEKKSLIKVRLYLEFYNFFGGFLYKKIGTGLLSSYKNQKLILKYAGIEYEENGSKDFDILQINTPWLRSLYLMKKAKKAGKKVIVWSHVSPEDMKKVFRFMAFIHPLAKKYLIYAYSQADLIFCPTEYTKGLMIGHGLPEKKLMAMSNGVDLERYFRDEEKRKKGREAFGTGCVTVGTVALIIPRKGIDTFLKMAENFPENKFVWIGKKYSSLLVKPLPKNLPANCEFTGYVDDILAAFNALDIFIFPSYEENEGMAILEAAALGLPILVRDIPVYEGWLTHGVDCLKAKNDEEFKKYLGELIVSAELREKLGQAALEVARKKSKAVLAERVVKVYEEILRG
ncbi:MAG: glycosyltransferase [Patescibacteria group bacterium]|jgi:1,2-diacylglycerol-3-alpha-glucose alpha-1,2-glucosyltransferase